MRKFWLLLVLIALGYLSIAQKYIFDSRAVYQGTGLFQNRTQRGKYILYWSSDKQILGLEIFDGEGSFVSMTIFDPGRNALIGLDEREKNGFQVNYQQYATNPVSGAMVDSSCLVGIETVKGKECRKYKYQFSDGQVASFCVGLGLFNADLLKILQKTGYAFLRVPYGFKGIILNYNLTDSKGDTLADLQLNELRQGAYYTFDLSKYRIQKY